MQAHNHQANEHLTEGEKHLAEGRILPLFARFAIPGILGFLFMGMQVLVDGILLGRFVGSNALAAISIVFPAIGVFFTGSVILNVGCQCLVGIKLGERKVREANDAFFTSFAINLFCIFAWSLPAFLFPAEISRALGANDVLADYCSTYLRIFSLSSVSAVLFLCNGALRAQGRPFYSLFAMSVMVLTNAVLDIVFICLLGWGIEGAAWATVISAFAGLSFSFPVFLRRKSRITLWRGRFNIRFAGQMLYNGSSEGLSELSAHISTFLFNITLMKFLGENGVAAFSSMGYIGFVAVAFFIGLVDGTRAIISFNYGQRSRDRILATLMISMQSILAVGFVFFFGVLFFREGIVSIFFKGSDPEVIRIAAYGAMIYSFTFPVQGLNILASGYFTAIGNAKLSIIISLLKGLVFIAIGLAVLPPLLGVDGIWATVPLAEYLTLGISFYMMRAAVKSLGREDKARLKLPV